jgi:hypothetical protein
MTWIGTRGSYMDNEFAMVLDVIADEKSVLDDALGTKELLALLREHHPEGDPYCEKNWPDCERLTRPRPIIRVASRVRRPRPQAA